MARAVVAAPRPHTVRADTRDELRAHRAEAIALVDGLMPFVSRLAFAATYLDPATHQAGRTVLDRLDRYRARHR